METYLRNLVQALQRVVADDDDRYSVLCDRHYIDELPLEHPAFGAVPCNYTRPSLGWFLRGVIRNVTRHDILRSVMNRLQVDLIHHPFSMLNPLRLDIPSVLTFHDMQHEFFPEYFSGYERKTRNEFSRPSAEQASRIIAISEHTKSCLVERYDVDPAKIDVIYNGYNRAYRVFEDPAGLEEIRSRYGLSKPFMYYPAATWPHKNHAALLQAFKIMKARHRFDGQLVLTGIAMRAHGKILHEAERLGVGSDVRALGYVRESDLPGLYNLARLMVFPSKFEGFGIPLVEAMACGCPIACSNATSIPEVVGDAGLTFEPASPEDIAEKTLSLWSDEGLRRKLIHTGLARVRSFTWDDTARKTIAVYRKALA